MSKAPKEEIKVSRKKGQDGRDDVDELRAAIDHLDAVSARIARLMQARAEEPVLASATALPTSPTADA